MVRVIRSGVEESAHLVDVAVVDPAGVLVAWAGDPSRVHFARSSMKPLQAAVSLSLSGVEFTASEVAVMCGSHNAEPVHLQAVVSILEKAGVPESALQCPARLPWDEQTALEQPHRRALNSDCSGKHAGMLAACRYQGWDLSSYRRPDHPLQREIHRAVLRATELENLGIGVDGCGIPVHALPLRSMATIYARFTAPGRWEALGEAVSKVVEGMTSEPYMVAGRNRPDTALMKTSEGLLVKGGAEGLTCAAVLRPNLGVAVKVRDGSSRAVAPALIRVLEELEALDGRAAPDLEAFARPAVLGGDQAVGELQVTVPLHRP